MILCEPSFSLQAEQYNLRHPHDSAKFCAIVSLLRSSHSF